MRSELRTPAAVAVAMAAHVAILAALPSPSLRVRWPAASHAPVELAILTRPREPAPADRLPAIRVQTAVIPRLAHHPPGEHPSPTPAHTAEPIRSPAPAPPSHPPPPPPAPAEREPAHAGRIELFPQATLAAIAGEPRPSFGGTARNGRSPPPSPEDGGAAAQRALSDWSRRKDGERDVGQGRVDPIWRDLERGIERTFHPDATDVTDEHRVTSLLRQYARALSTPPTGGPTPRGVDASRAAEPSTFVADQIAASQRALSEPGQWRRVEVTVTVDADGRVLEIALALGSGRGEIDRAALAAVRRAAAARVLLRDPRGRVTARYAVEAAVAVTPITATPVVDPVSGRVEGAGVPLFGLRFDANFKPVGLEHPLRREVRTRVTLLALERP